MTVLQAWEIYKTFRNTRYIHNSCKMSPRAHYPLLLINSLFALPSTGTKTFHWQASGSLLTKLPVGERFEGKCPNFRWKDNVEMHISNSRCLLRTMWIYYVHRYQNWRSLFPALHDITQWVAQPGPRSPRRPRLRPRLHHHQGVAPLLQLLGQPQPLEPEHSKCMLIICRTHSSIINNSECTLSCENCQLTNPRLTWLPPAWPPGWTAAWPRGGRGGWPACPTTHREPCQAS